MSRDRVLDAIEKLNLAVKRVDDIDESEIDLSKRVLENRIITLEGYLRYMESVGIPTIKEIRDFLEVDENDWPNLL